jgi:predicted acyl esterase
VELIDVLAHVRRRLTKLVRPGVEITEPPPVGVVFERDVPVVLRDGVVMRANVFRPEGPGRHPVLLSLHPYGKDALPRPRRWGRPGYRVPLQFRLLPQSEPIAISAWTGWEAPDPVAWVERGYVVVNADLRGWGRSDGVGELLSAQEGDDGHDLVEWAAAQPWSTGKVGFCGVSYLALTQWATAATRPPHLAAICPWEGFTDLYRDFARPGGVREDGFMVMWTTMLRAQRRSPVRIRREQRARPLVDGWWAARDRAIEAIDVPALVCGSFSDHNLHSRGSFEGYRRIGSTAKWLYTHRGPKWATFYGAEAQAFQQRFFDHFLKGAANGMVEVPPVRLEVREDAATVTSVRGESSWPPPTARWTELALDAGHAAMVTEPAISLLPASVAVGTRRGRASFTWVVPEDVEVVGPMVAHLHVEAVDVDDVSLFVGVRKLRHGRVVGFEGSYGFDRALMAQGCRKVSQRALDPSAGGPVPRHLEDRRQLLRPGEVVAVAVELAPSATRFRAGEQLRLDVQGRWFFPRNPLVGQFPAGYQPSARGGFVLHTGADHPTCLALPIVALA